LQATGRVVGVHRQRGQHERLAGARQLDETVKRVVQQHIVVHAPVGEMLSGDVLLLEPGQIMHRVEAVRGEEIGLGRELAIGTAQVVVAVALLLQVIAEAERLGQEAGHAAHAVLIALGGGQRHAAHRGHQSGDGPAAAIGRGEIAHVQGLPGKPLQIGHQPGEHAFVQIGALQAFTVDPDDVGFACQRTGRHHVFGCDCAVVHRLQLLVDASCIRIQRAAGQRRDQQRTETGEDGGAALAQMETPDPHQQQR